MTQGFIRHQPTAPLATTPPTTPAPTTSDDLLAPQLLLRFNHVSPARPGFPLEAELRGDAGARAELETQRAQAAEALYTLIPGLTDDAERRELLALRRTVLAGKSPRQLPPPLHARLPQAVHAYLHAWSAQEQRTAGLLGALDTHLTAERTALQATCRDERFLKALAVSSGALLATARQYAATPLAEQKGTLRKSEYRLLQYVSRAAWKTSPFSHYTSVAGGRWVPGGSALLTRPQIQASVTVNHVLLLRLLDGALKTPALRAALPWRLGDHLRVQGAEVRFEQALDDAVRQPRARNLASRRVTLRLSGGLARLIARVREDGGEASYAALVATLADLSADPQAPHRFLAQLMDSAFLLPVTGLTEQPADLPGEVAALLRRAGTTQAEVAAGALAALAGALQAFAALDSAARPGALDAARAHLAAAYEAYGLTLPAGPVLYEDTTAPAAQTLDPAPFQPALTRLHQLLAVLRVFDTHLLFGPLLRERVVGTLGRGARVDDLPTFVRDNADLFDEWLQASLRGPGEALRARPDLQEIFAVQREVRAAYLAATRAGQEELDLSEAQLQAWLERLPGCLTARPWSYDVFAQPAMGGTAAGLIVNQVYAGYGQYFSRFLATLPAQVTADVRATLRALAPGGHSQIGLRSAHGFTANLHPALTDTELQIDAPVAGAALSVNDLYLEHDEARDEVMLRRRDTGESVQIVYAGFLIAQLLPSLKNFLVTLTNNGLIVPHLPDIAEASLGPADGQIRRTPRLRAGPAVLHRARWSVPHAALPAPGPHTTDAGYALTLWRWAADHGLPAQVFMRRRRAARGSANLQAWQAELAGGTQKPQYLDFSSPLHARLLAKVLRDSPQDFVFEECRPLPEEALVQGDHGPLTSELVFELHQLPRTGGSL
ncbi:lantibiotic dehydratase [Deinococcus arcticus]|uniref:lantibiotic dehydratase n=1 Tax=Deinococcus arcticus TaxID=2136176 RepID=UPI0011B233BC|nr:lantibiotic dehydratase [Deinococcus arcticus]